MKSLIICLATLWYHPNHVSVTDINLNPKSGTIELSMQLFAEDLESVIRKYHDAEYMLDDKTFEGAPREVLIDYIKKNFMLNAQNAKVDIAFVGLEMTDDLVKCYFESGKVEAAASLVVTNTLFFDLHENQVNLNHVKANGHTHSAKTTVETPDAKIDLSEH